MNPNKLFNFSNKYINGSYSATGLFINLSTMLDDSQARRLYPVSRLSEAFEPLCANKEVFVKFEQLMLYLLEVGQSKFPLGPIGDVFQLQPNKSGLMTRMGMLFVGFHMLQSTRAYVLTAPDELLVRVKFYLEEKNDYKLRATLVARVKMNGSDYKIVDVLPTYDYAEHVADGWSPNKCRILASMVAEMKSSKKLNLPQQGEPSWNVGSTVKETVIDFGMAPCSLEGKSEFFQTIVAVERAGDPKLEVFSLIVDSEGAVIEDLSRATYALHELADAAEHVLDFMLVPPNTKAEERTAAGTGCQPASANATREGRQFQQHAAEELRAAAQEQRDATGAQADGTAPVSTFSGSEKVSSQATVAVVHEMRDLTSTPASEPGAEDLAESLQAGSRS